MSFREEGVFQVTTVIAVIVIRLTPPGFLCTGRDPVTAKPGGSKIFLLLASSSQVHALD